MKLKQKLLLSLVAGLLAASMYAAPLWWGVLFSPLSRQLTTEAVSDIGEAPVFRLKSLELLFSLFD